MTGVDLPHLVNVTGSGFSFKYAHNLSSLKMPKLERINSLLDIDLSGGLATNISFLSLSYVDGGGIYMTGEINA